MSLTTGKSSLIVPFAEAAKIPYSRGDWTGASHWFNHLLFSPDGSRFSFLHRWGVRQPNGNIPFTTRMFTARTDGTGPLRARPQRRHIALHLARPATHPGMGLASFARQQVLPVSGPDGPGGGGRPDVMTVNGHCTYLPGNRWILNDTYPDKQRDQNPYLYEVASGRRVPLGHFRLPPEYAGECRVRYAPALQPGRPEGGDRFGARRQRPADVPHRYRRDELDEQRSAAYLRYLLKNSSVRSQASLAAFSS